MKYIEQQYLKEITAEKIFMHNYDDTIKFVKADKNKVDTVVQDIFENSGELHI